MAASANPRPSPTQCTRTYRSIGGSRVVIYAPSLPEGPERPASKLDAEAYAVLFPAKPPALRKIAHALRYLSTGDKPFTIAQWELAAHAQVSRRTLQRYLPAFEAYGVVEIKRWRYKIFGPTSNTYRLFPGAHLPPDWRFGGGDYTVDARQRRAA
jgi:hypothetical protein